MTKNEGSHAKTAGRCDLCGVKSKPGSQFEFMCRNSAACKRRRLAAAAQEMLAVLERLQEQIDGAKRMGLDSIMINATRKDANAEAIRAAIIRATEGK